MNDYQFDVVLIYVNHKNIKTTEANLQFDNIWIQGIIYQAHLSRCCFRIALYRCQLWKYELEQCLNLNVSSVASVALCALELMSTIIPNLHDRIHVYRLIHPQTDIVL